MIIIPEHCKKVLGKYFPDYEKYTRLSDLLLEIDGFIIVEGLTDDQEELNDVGREVQILYDDIYYANVDD